MDLPGAVCTNCTTLQQAQVGGNSPLPLSSPANGVVISWAVRTGDPGALYTLRILRPAGTDTYLGAGSRPAPSAVPGGTTDSTISYPASLPIQQGDSIGIFTAGAATGLPQRVTSGINGNVIANDFTGGPPDGSSSAFTPDVQHELLLQATIKFCKVPDVKGLRLAAAQQALAAADCGSTVTKKKLKRSKKNKKKKGKVLTQSLAPNSTAAPGTPVALKVAALKKKRK